MVAFQNMSHVWVFLVMLLASASWAQKEEIFGNGKPPNFREEMMDRRFTKSKLAKLMVSGTDDPPCAQVLGGLFVALGEIAPTLHKKDENFVLPPELQEALQTQLSTPSFPALAYLVSMVRRVRIDNRLSDEWLATATALNKKTKLIDLAKLEMLNENLTLIDSAYFSIPVLRNQWQLEAINANSAVTTDVVAAFRDTYLDRDVAWGGATLLDIGINQPKGKKGKKKLYRDAEAEELVAVLQWIPEDPRLKEINLLAKAPVKVEPVIIYVRLAPKQYADIEKFHRGQRVMVKGRFWEMNNRVDQIEVRDGLIFQDRDWSQGVLIGRPQDVALCTAAINQLTGIAPDQPGGFGH
jgi:hypothetical protein